MLGQGVRAIANERIPMTASAIDGVLVTPLQRFANPKGDVAHAMKKSDPGFAGFGEAYFTTILPGQTKGWHKHRRMTMNLIVPAGAARFMVVDDRPESPTSGRSLSVELSAASYRRLTISPGLWTAFTCVGSEVGVILNLSSIEYDDAEVLRTGLERLPLKTDFSI